MKDCQLATSKGCSFPDWELKYNKVYVDEAARQVAWLNYCKNCYMIRSNTANYVMEENQWTDQDFASFKSKQLFIENKKE